MTEKNRVGVFYSLGQEFDQIIKSIREAFPDDHLVAMVPSAYVETEAIAPFVDEAIRTKYASYPSRQPWRTLDMIRTLRRERYDVFIVIFYSFKLRLLASLAGAPRVYCWALDGRVIPLETNIAAVLADIAKQTLLGWWRYGRVWWNIRFSRVGNVDPGTLSAGKGL